VNICHTVSTTVLCGKYCRHSLHCDWRSIPPSFLKESCECVLTTLMVTSTCSTFMDSREKRTSGQCLYKCNVPTTWQVSASGKCWLNISTTEMWLKVTSSRRLFHVNFPTKFLCAIMIYPIRATRSSLFSFWFDQRNNSRRRERIMKMLIIFSFIQPFIQIRSNTLLSILFSKPPPPRIHVLPRTQSRPTRSSRCCSKWHFELENILTLSLPKLKQNAETIQKNFELSIY
jgi:hypothetical protein